MGINLPLGNCAGNLRRKHFHLRAVGCFEYRSAEHTSTRRQLVSHFFPAGCDFSGGSSYMTCVQSCTLPFPDAARWPPCLEVATASVTLRWGRSSVALSSGGYAKDALKIAFVCRHIRINNVRTCRAFWVFFATEIVTLIIFFLTISI